MWGVCEFDVDHTFAAVHVVPGVDSVSEQRYLEYLSAFALGTTAGCFVVSLHFGEMTVSMVL